MYVNAINIYISLKSISFLYNKNKIRSIHLTTIKINYSSSSVASTSINSSLPIPIKVFHILNDNNIVLSYSELLKNKAGIYCFVNTVNGKRNFASAKDLYLRLIQHLYNKKSNIALQNGIVKQGLDKFESCAYEYFTYYSKVVNNKALTDLETNHIKKYPFACLYNFIRTATSLTGYKHTEESIWKC